MTGDADELGDIEPTGTDPNVGGATEGPGEAEAPGRNPIPIVVALVAVVLAGLVALFMFSGSSDGTDTTAQVVGKSAPPLAGTTISGEEFDLADESGRWVLVNFFATWCPPCVAEHPELVEFASRHPDDATVVSVAYNESPAQVEAFFAQNGGDWPVLSEAGDSSLDWSVVKLPESYLVSPDGDVVEKLNGGVDVAELEDLVAAHSGGGESSADLRDSRSGDGESG